MDAKDEEVPTALNEGPFLRTGMLFFFPPSIAQMISSFSLMSKVWDLIILSLFTVDEEYNVPVPCHNMVQPDAHCAVKAEPEKLHVS